MKKDILRVRIALAIYRRMMKHPDFVVDEKVMKERLQNLTRVPKSHRRTKGSNILQFQKRETVSMYHTS